MYITHVGTFPVSGFVPFLIASSGLPGRRNVSSDNAGNIVVILHTTSYSR